MPLLCARSTHSFFCSVRSDTYSESSTSEDYCPASNNLVRTACTPEATNSTDDPAYIRFSDDTWKCKGIGAERGEDRGGMIAIWINLVVQVFVWVPMVIGCCYFRNKSTNTAPFNGGAVQSFPQVAKATAAIPAQMQMIQMQCPVDASPGQAVQSNVNGQVRKRISCAQFCT